MCCVMMHAHGNYLPFSHMYLLRAPVSRCTCPYNPRTRSFSIYFLCPSFLSPCYSSQNSDPGRHLSDSVRGLSWQYPRHVLVCRGMPRTLPPHAATCHGCCHDNMPRNGYRIKTEARPATSATTAPTACDDMPRHAAKSARQVSRNVCRGKDRGKVRGKTDGNCRGKYRGK